MSSTTASGSIDAESEILPQHPPPWIIRFVAWLLLGFLSLAFIATIVLKLPETVAQLGYTSTTGDVVQLTDGARTEPVDHLRDGRAQRLLLG